MDEHAALRDRLRDYYGSVLARSEDLATNACCAAGSPEPRIAAALARVHEEVKARFYGCGFPIPEALDGASVLDLGCGAGRDAYVLSQLVGPAGFVHGLDMTEAQLEVARGTLDWHMQRFGFGKANVAFHQGYIEDLSSLPLEEEALDLVVSNCVVNLSPRKDRVLAEAFRVLRRGGEFYLSDVIADRRLPEEVVHDPLLHAECLGGALYAADFRALARAAGFLDPREIASAPIEIQSPEVQRRVGAARFHSVTYRLFKLPELDEQCEDYGQVATYRGGLADAEELFRLDEHHLFERGRPERVCGNTAAMLSETRLAPWFEVQGDCSVHYGPFVCGETLAAQQYRAREAAGAGESCC